MNELELFAAAIGVANPVERDAILDRECAGRAELRQRLQQLLSAHGRAEPILEHPKRPDITCTVADDSPKIGAIIAGRYKLLEEIGDGGMGTVWMAEQREPVKRLVAVKLIKAGMNSKAVLARFEAERQALALMDHPNIAKVHDAGTDDHGRPYFVMELVKGLSLTEYCDSRKLSVNERLDLFVQICSAVQHAHQKAIIHRDLKPTNVLVTEHDGKPVPKVIDFGLAKALNSSQMLTDRTLHTAYGTVVGTPLYMAPEQVGINALDVDTRTDIYALGVILYELLTGSTPLEKARIKEAAWEEMKRLIREEEPPRPSTRLSSSATLPSLAASRQIEPAQLSRLVRGELDWIVMKALEKDRTRRYETAIGLSKDVQRYLKGDAVEACPPTLGYRLRKAYRRNKTPAWIAAGFLGLVTFAGVTAGHLAVQAEAARKGEFAERRKAEQREAEANLQRDRAEREQKRAEEEKRASEAVRAFLQDDLLRQADTYAQANSMPMAGGEFEIKPNPTIRELLDRAAAQLTAERIEKRFPGMPFVQAEVLHAVANAYRGIFELERGRPLIDRAVLIYKSTRGDNDSATLKARKSQLELSSSLPPGQFDALLASFIDDATRVFGPRDRIVLEARMVQGISTAHKNRAAEATSSLKKLQTEMTESFGPTDALTLTCGAALAQAYVRDNQFFVAVREMEGLFDTVKGMTIRFDHPMLEEGYILLAETYRTKGDIKKTIEVYEEVLSGWKQRGQPYHANSWRTRHLLAWVYARNGNLAKGAELFEANVAAAPTTLGAYLSWDALRDAEVKLGRDDKTLIERARQGLAAAIGNRAAGYKSWVTGHARIRLGQQLMRTKEYTEAEALLTAGLREMIDEYAHIRDYSLNAIPEGQESLLDLYQATNRQAEGAKVMADIWAILEKRGGDARTFTVKHRHNLARTIIVNSPAEAAKLFEQNVRTASGPVDRGRALYGLHHAELNLGKVDAALDHARQALDALVSANGPAHRDFLTGQMRAAVGLMLVRQKKFAEAEPYLTAGCREIADHAAQIPDHEYPYIIDPFEAVITLYHDSNRLEKEKEWMAVKRDTFDKLVRQNLSSDKLTPNAVKLVQALVMAHVTAGRHDDAFALYRELDAKHAPVDPETADPWLRLSGHVMNTYESKLLLDRVKPWAAHRIPILERELEAVRTSKPSELAFLRAANSLAFSLLHAGRHADVIKLFNEVQTRQKANVWRTDSASVASYGAMAKAVALAGRPDLSTAMISTVLAEAKKAKSPQRVLAAATFSLGFARSHAGAHSEAEEHFREALRLQSDAGEKNWQMAKYKAWLGFALFEQEKYDAAEPVLRDAYAECIEMLATAPLWEKQHPLLLSERLAVLYEAKNDPKNAVVWKQKAKK